jgi:HAMP domain-containing protein
MATELAGSALEQMELLRVLTALKNGDFSQRMPSGQGGMAGEIARTLNTTLEFLGTFASEFARITHELGSEGRFGGQAEIEGVSGIWKDLTDRLNLMGCNLTGQFRNIAQITTAIATGDLSRKVTVECEGEVLELKQTLNTMADQLNAFTSEMSRIAREVAPEGKLGGQAVVQGVSGAWKTALDDQNVMSRILTDQVRDMNQVLARMTAGEFDRRVTVAAQLELLELKELINDLFDSLAPTHGAASIAVLQFDGVGDRRPAH